MNSPHFARLEFAKTIAREAGQLTLKLFYSPKLPVERKSDNSPVTEADRGAELHLRKRIAEQFPDDAILGEEFPEQSGKSGFRWILDPIDGTKSFIHGVPIYSTLIGLEHEHECVVGIIAIPALREMIWAEKGQGAWFETPRNAEPIQARVSPTARLEEACFLTSEVLTFVQCGRDSLYNELQRRTLLTRTWGDAYGYYLVATGRADLMIDPQLSLWDAGPLLVILEEAGGCFTDWSGNRTIYSEEGVASNGHLHDSVLALTRNCPKKIV
ncbi:MAG: histidinol-phosphatase [Thermoguttaceae bacterium]